MTPRGTTYVTVGSHGFYYRETLSQPGGVHIHPADAAPVQPQLDTTDGVILSAPASDLVDSSSERMIQQLNERANMFNPAWLLYIGGVLALCALAMVPSPPALPNLPDVKQPFKDSRVSNTIDDFSMITGRYGEASSILYAEADPLDPVPIGTARYLAAGMKILFVPNGCVRAYQQVMESIDDKTRNPALAKREMKNAAQCLPSSKAGWTIVGYIDSVQNSPLGADAATARLEAVAVRQTVVPTVEPGSKLPTLRSVARKPITWPEMKSDDQSREAESRLRRQIENGEREALYSRLALVLMALVLFAAGLVVHKRNTAKRASRLFYELDEREQQKYAIIQQSFGLLSQCHRIWQIEAEAATSDWKRNAGASSLVRRKSISIGNNKPPRVEANVSVPCANLGRSQLFFLPDTILYRDGGGYGAIAYSDFRVAQSFTRFIEDGEVPGDASVVGHTWRYVNKNGGPDRRFNNNRQLPVLQLGVLNFTSSKGLNVQLKTSNPQQSLAFADCWRTLFQQTSQSQDRRDAPKLPVEKQSDAKTQARNILGVTSDASDAEISAAYRRLAQLYHPDKVAGLAPEFQLLADSRMKEINAAYELLKGRNSPN